MASRREIFEGTELPPEVQRTSRDPETIRRNVTRVVVLAVAAFALVAIFSCRQLPRSEDVPLHAFPGPFKDAPKVRLIVRQKAQAVNLAVTGPFRLYDGSGAEIPITMKRLAAAPVTFRDRCLAVGSLPLRPNSEDLGRLRIVPEKSGTVEISGQVFPGDVELIGVRGTSTLHVVVHMDIEEYLCGVLAGEVPVDRWNEEALRAQAVASRTYALYYSLRNASDPWDFGMTGREAQEYRPGVSRNAKINLAVNSTRGEVLTWNNMIFPAWFHSSCGGHTVDATAVFTRRHIDALGGAECRWCRQQPDNKYASWKRDINFTVIADRLAKELSDDPEVGPTMRKITKNKPLRSLEVAEKAPDGRITKFLARGPGDPGSVEIRANDVRLAIGPSELPSTNCSMTPGSRYRFEGAGWGHGVGLCQFGAQGQAQDGRNYQEILATYFPSSRIVKMAYSLPERR
ncbi:MAG TPA: SpoIID/LytB domain-containing protein [Planctomycetota bacterium]|nr:SpoIID/LytB domain-containing protein [Planctomycetota bacterium]